MSKAAEEMVHNARELKTLSKLSTDTASSADKVAVGYNKAVKKLVTHGFTGSGTSRDGLGPVYGGAVFGPELVGEAIVDTLLECRQCNPGSDFFTEAVAGLEHLKTFYTQTNSVAKAAWVAKILRDADRGSFDYDKDITAMRQRHVTHLTIGIEQGALLTKDHGGVCYAFVLHWARRIIMKKNKPHYGHTKGQVLQGVAAPDDDQVKRFARKIQNDGEGGGIRLHQSMGRQPLKAVKAGQVTSAIQNVEREPFLRKFAGMKVTQLSDRVTDIGYWLPKSGDDIILDALKQGQAANAEVLLLGLTNKDSNIGHAVGLRRTGVFQLFDPNCGEWLFPSGSAKEAINFTDDWWSTMYGGSGALAVNDFTGYLVYSITA